jgi:peptidoglycan/LPS O-acetylase OafA/YrhL
VPELDGLRGLAALGIVLFHSNPKRLPCGWAAVDLFFVLSGYLITSIILVHGSRPGFLRSFYVRRGLRIWPIYFLTIGLFVLLDPWLPAPQNFAALPFDLTYTQNVPAYWTDQLPTFSRYLRHTWTLAIEEQFYLIWPLLVLAVGRRGLVPLSLTVVGGAVLARSQGMPIVALAARADGLALGGLLAAILSRPSPVPATRRVRPRWAFDAAMAVGSAGVITLSLTIGLNLPMGPPPWPGLTILMINLVWFGLIGRTVLGADGPGSSVLRRRLRGPRLGHVGRISYGLYLYHLPILLISGDIARSFGLRGQPFWREGPTLALCGLAAVVSWRYLEEPILGLKDRWAGYPSHGRNAIEPLRLDRRVMTTGIEPETRGQGRHVADANAGGAGGLRAMAAPGRQPRLRRFRLGGGRR